MSLSLDRFADMDVKQTCWKAMLYYNYVNFRQVGRHVTMTKLVKVFYIFVRLTVYAKTKKQPNCIPLLIQFSQQSMIVL